MNQKENPLIKSENIDVSYGGESVIQDLSITVEAGTLVGLIGPNGAGKTTLLMSISGQFKPVKGKIYFDGNDVYKANREYKRFVGYVHENPFFYPYLTAEDFMRFIAGIKDVSDEDAEDRIESLLKSVDVWEERDKVTSALSMGMRKKLAIAAAMIGAPRVLFLDEALNGVDFESAYRIKHSLRDFVAAGGSVILSTHTLEVIEKICDRYVVLKEGRIIADLRAGDVTGEAGSGGGSLEQYVMQLLADKRPND
jgi:ABC-2 type transport system ATP-binding protein